MGTSQERRHALAETVAEYGTPAETRYEKLSVSLPAELLQEVRQAAGESGTSVSGVIAAALRQSLDRVEQDRLDQALAQDASDNEAWARDALAMTARAWADLKW
jgi:Arc/MetJ-type ribon-helix-helix transcriptional regulator